MKKKHVIWLILLIIFLIIMLGVLFNKTTSIDNYVYNLVASNITNNKTTFFKVITFFVVHTVWHTRSINY